MDLSLSPEQEQIVDTARGFLSKKQPVLDIVKSATPDQEYNPARANELWQEMAAMGWIGLAVPDTQGGVGYTVAEEILIAREAGRALAPVSILATLMGVHVAIKAGRKDLVEGALAGDLRIAGATQSDVGTSGRRDVMVCGDIEADFALVVEGPTYRLLALAGAEQLPCGASMDPSTPLRCLRLPATAEQAASADVDLNARADTLTAGYFTGLSEAMRELAVEHATTRIQFDRPIGSFQAIKHRCSTMALRSESGWAQACFAAASIVENKPDAAFHARAANLLAYEGAVNGAYDVIQILGGMGNTVEHPAHLYMERTHMLAGTLCVGRLRKKAMLELEPSL